MSAYLRMWELIKQTSVEKRQEFLNEHEPARGVDLNFQGETFLDVDLLAAIRNSIHQGV